MCSIPAPRRCRERVTAPKAVANPDEASIPVAPSVVYALEIARSVALDEPAIGAYDEPRARRRAVG
jgi:hypothetical protein